MKCTLQSAAAIAMVLFSMNAASAASQNCNQNEVYSSSMGQCIPKSAMCSSNEVYSSSMSRRIPKAAMDALPGTPVRLRTQFTGQMKCLDIINDGQNNKLTMAACGNFTGQMWKTSKY
jgi:hypothetical protein